MYLLHCKNCSHTYSLKESGVSSCHCELTSGILVKEDNKQKVSYQGDPFFLHVNDFEFGEALQAHIRDKEVKKITFTLLPNTHEDFISQ